MARSCGALLAEPLMRLAVLVSLLATLFSWAGGPAFGQTQVNVYNWSDYIAESELKNFEKDTGIKVNYTSYDSNEILDAKLKTGRSGYDVVVPTASPFFVRQLAAGLFLPLDRTKLKNFRTSIPTSWRRSPSTIPATPTPSPGCGAPRASATTSPKSRNACPMRRSIR